MTPSKLVHEAPASPAEWDRLAAASPGATFFHTRAWAELWSAGGKRAEARLFRFDDGFEALLPALNAPALKGLARLHYSSPEETYGGFIFPSEPSGAHSAALWERAAKMNLILRENPYAPLPSPPPGGWTREDFTQSVDLRKGMEPLRAEWGAGKAVTIRNARKAQKSGVTIEPAGGEGDWRAYYDVYLDSRRRWGAEAGPMYDWSLFEKLRALGSPGVRLWIARWEGKKVAAGAVCLYHNRKVVYWHGATLESAMNLRPSNLLHCEVIEASCREGMGWYDFNPSGGHEGVIQFKDRFAPTRLASRVWVNHSGLLKVWKRARG